MPKKKKGGRKKKHSRVTDKVIGDAIGLYGRTGTINWLYDRFPQVKSIEEAEAKVVGWESRHPGRVPRPATKKNPAKKPPGENVEMEFRSMADARRTAALYRKKGYTVGVAPDGKKAVATFKMPPCFRCGSRVTKLCECGSPTCGKAACVCGCGKTVHTMRQGVARGIVPKRLTRNIKFKKPKLKKRKKMTKAQKAAAKKLAGDTAAGAALGVVGGPPGVAVGAASSAAISGAEIAYAKRKKKKGAKNVEKNIPVRFVESYMELGFGERGRMRDRSGKLIEIHRTKQGDFGLGWPEGTGFMSRLDSSFHPRWGTANPACAFCREGEGTWDFPVVGEGRCVKICESCHRKAAEALWEDIHAKVPSSANPVAAKVRRYEERDGGEVWYKSDPIGTFVRVGSGTQFRSGQYATMKSDAADVAKHLETHSPYESTWQAERVLADLAGGVDVVYLSTGEPYYGPRANPEKEYVQVGKWRASRWRCPHCYRGLIDGHSCVVHGRLEDGVAPVDITVSKEAQHTAREIRRDMSPEQKREYTWKKAANPHGDTMTPKTAELFTQRMKAYNAIDGPRVGDYVRFSDGTPTRITEKWGPFEDGTEARLQTGGHKHGSFYLGEGHISYSGGLDPAISACTVELTGETMPGAVWLFKDDYAGAGRGVDFMMDFRVFRFLGDESRLSWRANPYEIGEFIRRPRKYGTAIIRYPTGKYGVVGAMPVELTKPVPSSLTPGARTSKVWDSEQEVIDALLAIGVTEFQLADTTGYGRGEANPDLSLPAFAALSVGVGALSWMLGRSAYEFLEPDIKRARSRLYQGAEANPVTKEELLERRAHWAGLAASREASGDAPGAMEAREMEELAASLLAVRAKNPAADPVPMPETPCEECGQPLGPEAYLSKHSVCGVCTRKRHGHALRANSPKCPTCGVEKTLRTCAMCGTGSWEGNCGHVPAHLHGAADGLLHCPECIAKPGWATPRRYPPAEHPRGCRCPLCQILRRGV